MPHGYTGKILRVNLSSLSLLTEQPEERFYRKYFGGWGFITYYLLKEVKAGIDPLGPDNKLIFAAGPLTGAPFSGSGRNSVGAKSPLTGGFGAAEVGGFWGSEFKRAGYDGIIIEGKASKPVYLWITDGKAEIKDASHLWGKDTGDTLDTIRDELGDRFIRFAGIGIGSENLVRYGNIIVDLKDAAGRTGLGAVMGSKKLKAIAVRGHNPVDVADKSVLVEMNRKMATEFLGGTKALSMFGTGSIIDKYAQSGNLPTRNFRDGNFENADAISARTIKETISVGMDACWACFVRCKKMVKIGEPWNVDPKYGGPEYETLAALGSNCGINDLNAISKAHQMCNRYSIDTISTGATIAFAMECFENGIITEADTDGIQLNFGNSDAMLAMVEKIAKREGFGDLLAEGSKKAAERIGKNSEKFAIHVKGQEQPMHEPRLKRGLGLGYAVSPTGADHIHNIHDTSYSLKESLINLEGLGIHEPLPAHDLSVKKVRLFTYVAMWRTLCHSLVTCIFIPWTPLQTVKLVKAVTGWDTSVWELMKVSERSINLARIFNIREGFTAEDDKLPDRMFQPQTSGALSKIDIDKEEFYNAVHTYYGMMGWDYNTGIPNRWKLEELGIGWAADFLEE